VFSRGNATRERRNSRYGNDTLAAICSPVISGHVETPFEGLLFSPFSEFPRILFRSTFPLSLFIQLPLCCPDVRDV